MQGYFGEKFSRVQCWIDLLLLAEWKDGRVFYIRGNKVVVNRGEVAISVKQLCERWGYSNKTIISRLREFVENGMITIKRQHTVNIISVVNYEKYQADENEPEKNFPVENSTFDAQESTQQKRNVNNLYSDDYEQADNDTTQQTTQQTTQPLRRERIYNISNNTSACVRTHEDDFFKELLNAEIWKEQMCMKHKIGKDELEQWIKSFRLDAECRGKTHDNIGDVKQHFNDWLRIQLRINNDAEDRKKSKIQRRGFEGTVSEAEDYTTTF